MLHVLSVFGFPQETVALIGHLYSDRTSELLVNRQLSPSFCVTRGIRQGCPLFLLLFVLCLDPLLRRVADSAAFPYPARARSRFRPFRDAVEWEKIAERQSFDISKQLRHELRMNSAKITKHCVRVAEKETN